MSGNQKQAKDNHVEQRRKERAKHVSKKQISKLKDAIETKQKKIPEGSHHVKLDNAYGVLKDVGDKHVLSTIYGPNMKPPGKDLTGAILRRQTAPETLALAADVAGVI
jgi:replication fork clamp-binding protein CrfC